jgi:hypothetical protein
LNDGLFQCLAHVRKALAQHVGIDAGGGLDRLGRRVVYRANEALQGDGLPKIKPIPQALSHIGRVSHGVGHALADQKAQQF